MGYPLHCGTLWKVSSASRDCYGVVVEEPFAAVFREHALHFGPERGVAAASVLQKRGPLAFPQFHCAMEQLLYAPSGRGPSASSHPPRQQRGAIP